MKAARPSFNGGRAPFDTMAHVKAVKAWNDERFGEIRAGDEFEVSDAQAEAWVRRGRVTIVESKPEERRTKPVGPSQTKPDGPSVKKSIKLNEIGKGWFSVAVDGSEVTKEDGSVRKFRKDAADKFVRDLL